VKICGERAARRGGILRAHILALAAMTVGGGVAHAMTITPTFESSITSSSDVGTIESDINSALTFYDQNFTNSINVNIAFTITPTTSTASYLGQSNSTIYSTSYTTYTAHMLANAAATNNAIEQTAYNNLGSGNDSNGRTPLAVTSADMRAISGNSSYGGGLNAAGQVNSGGTYDGIITLNAAKLSGFGGSGSYSAGRVIQHEVDEVLGIGGAGSTLNSSSTTTTPAHYGPMDLFRYSGAGIPSYTNSSSATSYFSIDGGNTNIVNFNQNPGNGQSGGDFGDWSSEGTTGNYVQLAFTSSSLGSASVSLTSPEGIALQAIGYDAATPEPSSLALSAALLCGMWVTLRRRRVGRVS
jgi:hypothetical protein